MWASKGSLYVNKTNKQFIYDIKYHGGAIRGKMSKRAPWEAIIIKKVEKHLYVLKEENKYYLILGFNKVIQDTCLTANAY